MPDALAAALPLILAGVLVWSGIAKLRHPDDLSGWAELGVPKVFRRTWLLRLHPWGELALAVALVLLGGWLGLAAALVALVLMVAYLVLVARAVSAASDSSCACFGDRKPVTRATVTRNAWLVALAVGVAAVIWATPLLGGAVVVAASEPWWIVALAVAAVTVALVLWPEPTAEESEEPAAPAPAAADPLDDEYVRLRTPAVPVSLADGTVVNLRTLAMSKPILLLALSETCGACASVNARVDDWRALLPEVDVRRLLTTDPATTTWADTDEPQSLHDPQGYVRGSIEDWGTPSAVLLGADGLLAGGPVTGANDISQFVADIYESLHGEPPPA
ncbi:hypothetical protein GCM10022200_18260 [Microbacterium awajiense]|uniref:Methylamine utilisation protein MauE domain-containing protein n=1 Tax=Microbacterium awajiense TaxID=415214 RepID=A0ABP7AMA6_9MICO